MTLSRFLRDYVFMPLADMRIAGTGTPRAICRWRSWLTMALCGLWHGAGWNFVLWGTMQGAAIVFALGWRRVLPTPQKSSAGPRRSAFFLLSGVMFRTPTLDAAWNVYSGLATLARRPACWARHGSSGWRCCWPSRCRRRRNCAIELQLRPVAWVPAALGLVGIALLVQLGGNESYEFIYFRF